MAESINTIVLLSSGGHVWQWGPLVVVDKVLRTAGTAGAARMVLVNGERPFSIVGRAGSEGPILRASGANKGAADTALNALQTAIDSLRSAGTPVVWEDDCGRTGSYLVVTEFEPVGERYYSPDGANIQAWQHYRMSGVELAGRPPPA